MTRQRIGFGLPNEITLVILHMLSDYGLSQLMGVCRLLHEHALRILLIRATVLDRIGCDLPKEIVMHDYPRLRALDALAWTYLVTTLDLFDCKIKGTESHLLSTICRCLKYSQTIQTVKISMSVNEWVSLSDPLGRAISWQIIPLIKSLESTHCQSLSLEERQCWIPEQTLYASAPKLEAAIKALRPLTTLTSLTLSIPLLFARDFRSWTVQTMNLSPLQYLRIEDWTTEAGSWGVVFEFLRLKHLQKLELSVCNLPAPCLTRFLKRHNCLTELSVTQEPKPAFAILDCRALPRLRSLTCTPSLALAFLQGRSSLPSLTSLEIVQCEAATPRTLEAILRRLSKRPSPNDMHLGFSRSTFTRDLFLERWIATCNELALNPSFKGLAHVRSLLLETRCSKLNKEKAVAALQCFPSLKSVNFFIDDYEEWYTEDSLYDIGERIVDDYPGLDGKVCFTV